MGNTTDNDSAQWIARGDEPMENLIVNWGGFQVGCISCKSGFTKHTVCFSSKYIVSILVNED